MSPNVEVMIMDNNVCNEKSFTALVLSFSNLKVFEVGDYSFAFVDEVKLIGLNQLERVVIGMNSFTKEKNSAGHDPKGLGVSCKSGTFSLIFYYIPLYHILVTGHPYHIRTPR